MTKCVLGDVAKRVQTGPFGSQLHQADYSPSGTPVVMPKDLADGAIVDATIARVGPQHVERLAKHKLKEGDLLFSRRGDIGRCALVRKEQEGWLCGTGCLRVELDAEKADYNYLYYFLRRDDVAKWLESHAVGAIMLNINPSIVSQLPIALPPLDVQRNIAKVLSTIDRKIALNRKRIATLEAMAKEIYDYWFVQFDFPDAHGRPYKSSGGAMVYNSDLKREIPKGWEVKPLGDIATFRNGINYDKSEIGDAEYRIVNVRNISESTFLIRHKDLDKIILRQTLADRFLLGSGDIIVARSGTPGATRIILNPERTIFCGFIICCSPIQDAHRILLAQRLQSIQGSLLDTSGGSVLKNVSQDTLKSIPVELPPDDVLCRFNETMLTVIRSIDSAQKSAVEMADLRDFLLPLLMNGQVKVG